MEPVTLTATAIAELAFKKFLETGVGKATEKLTEAAVAKMDQLRKKIWDKLRGNYTAETALAAVEQGSKSDLDRLVSHLQTAMDKDPQFASDIQAFAQEINAGKLQNNSSMTMNTYDNSTGYQTKNEGGTNFVGGTHYHGHP